MPYPPWRRYPPGNPRSGNGSLFRSGWARRGGPPRGGARPAGRGVATRGQETHGCFVALGRVAKAFAVGILAELGEDCVHMVLHIVARPGARARARRMGVQVRLIVRVMRPHVTKLAWRKDL